MNIQVHSKNLFLITKFNFCLFDRKIAELKILYYLLKLNKTNETKISLYLAKISNLIYLLKARFYIFEF